MSAYQPPRVLDLSCLAAGDGEAVQWHGGRMTLLKGDCIASMRRMPENHFDAIITDPPYHYDTIVQRFSATDAAPAGEGSDGLFKRASAGFMGKAWDGGDIAFRPETWAEVLRVLKPGGHLAAFSAPKCVHKMAFAIEAAGFEVRDRIINLTDPDPALIAFLDSLSTAQADALFRLCDQFGSLGEAFWCFGTGFPKSHDVSKAIDRMLGANRERQPVQFRKQASSAIHNSGFGAAEWSPQVNTAATPQAAAWEGWGTALKPAYEPIVIARKPLAEKSVAAQVLATGTGGIHVDATRIGWLGDGDKAAAAAAAAAAGFAKSRAEGKTTQSQSIGKESRSGDNAYDPDSVTGRWPANLVHDGSVVATDGFGDVSGSRFTDHEVGAPSRGVTYGDSGGQPRIRYEMAPGSASRFFYSGKADAGDRLGAGHPTVKPVDLMAWLCRMLAPKGGIVLDPFGGTGSTAEAAFREGMSAVLCEMDGDYQADITRRMELLLEGPGTRKRRAAEAKALRRKAQAAKTEQPSGDAAPAADLEALLTGQTIPDGGGGERSTGRSPMRTADGGIMAGKGGFGFRIREMRERNGE